MSSTEQDFKELLAAQKKMEAMNPNFSKFKRFLEEKREKGIVPRKVSKVPNLQETERYGYERFLIRQP